MTRQSAPSYDELGNPPSHPHRFSQSHHHQRKGAPASVGPEQAYSRSRFFAWIHLFVSAPALSGPRRPDDAGLRGFAPCTMGRKSAGDGLDGLAFRSDDAVPGVLQCPQRVDFCSMTLIRYGSRSAWETRLLVDCFKITLGSTLSMFRTLGSRAEASLMSPVPSCDTIRAFCEKQTRWCLP